MRKPYSFGIQQVWETLKTYAGKVGVEEGNHPHTVRHTFANDLYREIGKIRLVQKALRYDDPADILLVCNRVPAAGFTN